MLTFIRKQANPTRCDTCRRAGTASPTRHASAKERAAAVDMYFDGLGEKTPAVSAGADAPFKSWLDIATLEDAA